MKLQTARGVKDYLPEEMIVLNQIMDKLKFYFEKAGYNPVTTPVIERIDLLAGKYAGGAEILKETFQFEDQGKRKLGLRYDLTVPFARIIGQNPQLKMPFKRHQMEKVYRDGPVGPGRYREFWQCDIDVVGAKSMKAEAELLSIVDVFFKDFDLDYTIKLNNRKLISSILDKFNIQNKDPVILVLDKYFKLRKEELVNELIELSYDKKESETLIDTFTTLNKLKTNEEKLEECKKLVETDEGKEGIAELEELINLAKAYGVVDIEFTPILARGLSYYTSSVFEVVLKNNEFKSSVTAGGRYDKMIGDFLGSKTAYPAVGISFGVSRIFDALVASKKIETKKTVTKVLAISLDQDDETIKIVKELRSAGINVEVDLMSRNMKKNLTYANTLEIPYALLIGENEVKEGKFTLKELNSGEQKSYSLKELVKVLGEK